MKLNMSGNRVKLGTVNTGLLYELMKDNGLGVFCRTIRLDDAADSIYNLSGQYSNATLVKQHEFYDNDPEKFKANLKRLFLKIITDHFEGTLPDDILKTYEKPIDDYLSLIDLTYYTDVRGTHVNIKYDYDVNTREYTPYDNSRGEFKTLPPLITEPTLDISIHKYAASSVDVGLVMEDEVEELYSIYVNLRMIGNNPIISLKFSPVNNFYNYDFQGNDINEASSYYTDISMENADELISLIQKYPDYRISGFIRSYGPSNNSMTIDMNDMSHEDIEEIFNYINEVKNVSMSVVITKSEISRMNIIEEMKLREEFKVNIVCMISCILKEKFESNKIIEFCHTRGYNWKLYTSNFYDLNKLLLGEEVRVSEFNSIMDDYDNTRQSQIFDPSKVALNETGRYKMMMSNSMSGMWNNEKLLCLHKLLDDNIHLDYKFDTVLALLNMLNMKTVQSSYHILVSKNRSEVLSEISDLIHTTFVGADKDAILGSRTAAMINNYKSIASIYGLSEDDRPTISNMVLVEDLPHIVKLIKRVQEPGIIGPISATSPGTSNFIFEATLDVENIDVYTDVTNKFISKAFPGVSIHCKLTKLKPEDAAITGPFATNDDSDQYQILVDFIKDDSSEFEISSNLWSSTINRTVYIPKERRYITFPIGINLRVESTKESSEARVLSICAMTEGIPEFSMMNMDNNSKLKEIYIDHRTMKEYTFDESKLEGRLGFINTNNVYGYHYGMYRLGFSKLSYMVDPKDIQSFSKEDYVGDFSDKYIMIGDDAGIVDVSETVKYTPGMFNGYSSTRRVKISELNEELSVCVITNPLGKMNSFYIKVDAMKNKETFELPIIKKDDKSMVFVLEEGVCYFRYTMDGVMKSTVAVPSLSLVNSFVNGNPVWIQFVLEQNEYALMNNVAFADCLTSLTRHVLYDGSSENSPYDQGVLALFEYAIGAFKDDAAGVKFYK